MNSIPNSKSSDGAENEALRQLRALSQSFALKTIQDILGAAAELHLVGGTIRDLLSGSAPAEIDLSCALPPERSTELLTQAGIRVIPTGIEHGTITLVIEQESIELTTFRKPSAREAGRFSSTITEDLSGRDFTINALAYSLNSGSLIDPFQGQADLKTGILRAVGSPLERLKEDPHRILRMVRFGPAQGRRVDPALRDAARELGPLLAKVSPERIRSELNKILVAPCPAEAMRMLLELELLPYTLPELLPTVGFEQNEFHIHDVFEHTLSVLQACKPDLILRLAAIFHDIGKTHTLSVDAEGRRHFYDHEAVSVKICKEAMLKLKYSHEEISAVSAVISMHMRPLNCGPAAVRRLIRDLGAYFDQWLAFKIADMSPKTDAGEFAREAAQFREMVSVERERQKGSVYGKLAIDGYDLIALGLKPGVFLGSVLKEVENLVIENPELNEKENLLKKASEIIAAKTPCA